MHFLIMGVGVVGQVYGAYLQKNGHKVTFLTRDKYLAKFQDNGITVQEGNSAKKIQIRECSFVTKLNDLKGVDYLFVCFRSEQLHEATDLLANLDCSATQGVICFPVWNHSSISIKERFRSCHYLMPGISGLFRDDGIYFKHGTTRVGPFQNASHKETRELCSLISHAGLPTAFDPELVRNVQRMLAIGLPLVAGLSIDNFSIDQFAKDRGLLLLAVNAQKECLEIIEAGGDSIGLWANVLAPIPSSVIAFLLRFAPLFARGFVREMLHVHFKKIHHQTIYELKELSTFEFASNVRKDNLEDLLSRCRD